MSQDQTPRPARQPEKKIGPFAGGISVAIWVNTAETPDGPKPFRSVTIAPRRYLDRESGEWKDASSYNPGQLPALVFALQKALEFVLETPLPDQKAVDADAREPDELPF